MKRQFEYYFTPNYKGKWFKPFDCRAQSHQPIK